MDGYTSSDKSRPSPFAVPLAFVLSLFLLLNSKMRTFIALTGLGMVVADPNCTYDDYYYLGDLPIADVSDCLTTGSVDNWGVCISDHNINEVCTVDLAEHIVDEISTCATPCQNTSSAACRICSGVVVMYSSCAFTC